MGYARNCDPLRLFRHCFDPLVALRAGAGRRRSVTAARVVIARRRLINSRFTLSFAAGSLIQSRFEIARTIDALRDLPGLHEKEAEALKSAVAALRGMERTGKSRHCYFAEFAIPSSKNGTVEA
jgi:hypothetical protein